MVSLKDIAKAASTTPSTVSLVLNGKGKQNRISDKLAGKIQETAKKMGYVPNQIAVTLRTGKSKTIGLIVENISDSFFSSLAKTVEDEFRKFGYNVVYCSTENDARTGSELIKMLYNQQVDGYLITPTIGMEAEIKKLLAHNKPVVLMDRFLPDLDSAHVLVDNFQGMLKGVRHLIDSGYKKIGFVTVDLDMIQMKERLRAFQAALKEAGLPEAHGPILTLQYSNTPKQSVHKIKAFLQKEKKLEAVVFTTNYLGVYGLESIQLLQRKVPKDIGVLCFDDNEVFKLHTPNITVVEQPVFEIAQTAVKILMGLMGLVTRTKEAKVQLKTRLIIRGSV